ncbi:hypothetical protein E2562_039256 [Oryza meyeriana var. granulata]|uniref:Uncharacterized protein n=1 Tax=Oryza meyeriana var. granulata TaxID=110450 RepID=A0A6G1F2B6_9ORYZ|nr:hypothetical protein E2562_039256 [Oryza meyeriana var. granulata]
MELGGADQAGTGDVQLDFCQEQYESINGGGNTRAASGSGHCSLFACRCSSYSAEDRGRAQVCLGVGKMSSYSAAMVMRAHRQW